MSTILSALQWVLICSLCARALYLWRYPKLAEPKTRHIINFQGCTFAENVEQATIARYVAEAIEGADRSETR